MKLFVTILLFLAVAFGDHRAAKRLIKISDEISPEWVTEDEILTLIRVGVNFMDITDFQDLEQGSIPKVDMAFPAVPTHQNTVNSLISEIVHQRYIDDLTYFSQNFYTRYYRSTTGTDSANWLFGRVKEAANNRTDITVSQITHSGYNQKSIVAKIAGKNANGPLVIIGGHQDSINVRNVNNRSPGADDDGSGSISVLEIFRTLAGSGFVPELPTEFHFYAGEEAGLLGSQDIATRYKNAGTPVYGMFNLDMTGYTEPGLQVRVLYDYINAELTTFTTKVIEEYTTLKWRTYTCGYACSDHASWNRAGYASSTTFEPKSNPQIHTEKDDLDLIVWDQTYEFLKLGLAVVVELSYGA